MSALEKAPNPDPTMADQPAEQAGIFLESYPITYDFVAMRAIQSKLIGYQQQHQRIYQFPGPKSPDGIPTIEVWA